MPAWSAFIGWAQQGGSFLYYPDASATACDEYWLEDTNGSARSSTPIMAWNPTMASGTIMMAAFEITLRKVPGGIHSS